MFTASCTASCAFNIPEATRQRSAFRLTQALKNRRGTTGADFRFIGRDGTESTLHRALRGAAQTIVMFYDPDCEVCADVEKRLASDQELITSHLFNTGDQATNNRLISYVTLIIMILRIVELLIDPFIGNAIDRTKTRWGHFRPWVVIGGTVSSIALLILFTNMGGLNKTNPWLYLFIF